MSSLPKGFFDAPGATSASLSGREHVVSGFFDKPEEPPSKRAKHEEEEEMEEDDGRQEEDEKEEEEMDEAEALDKMLEEAEPVEVWDQAQVTPSR
jgi:ribosomal protein L9